MPTSSLLFLRVYVLSFFCPLLRTGLQHTPRVRVPRQEAGVLLGAQAGRHGRPKAAKENPFRGLLIGRRRRRLRRLSRHHRSQRPGRQRRDRARQRSATKAVAARGSEEEGEDGGKLVIGDSAEISDGGLVCGVEYVRSREFGGEWNEERGCIDHAAPPAHYSPFCIVSVLSDLFIFLSVVV